MAFNRECSICNIISQPDNDDVTLFDNETVGTGWRIALMNDSALDGTPTHVHFKLRPRGFVPVEIGQERFSDAGFGTKIISPHKVERSTLELIQEHLERDR